MVESHSAIKRQRKENMHPGFGCLELCLYGIRELASATNVNFVPHRDFELTTFNCG